MTPQRRRQSSMSNLSPMPPSPRRRLKVRESLGLPGMRELDLGRRMGMLREVAEDYIVKSLREDREDDEDVEELERAWNGLQGELLCCRSSLQCCGRHMYLPIAHLRFQVWMMWGKDCIRNTCRTSPWKMSPTLYD